RAAMNLARLYFASNVLTDGRVFVEGGEYSGPNGAQNFTNTGEIYNPVANTWSSITNFPNANFGDDPSELLPDGRVFTGYISRPACLHLQPHDERLDLRREQAAQRPERRGDLDQAARRQHPVLRHLLQRLDGRRPRPALRPRDEHLGGHRHRPRGTQQPGPRL